ncbi:flagellar biosynthetic protein FliQ [Silanimonas lenta]|uniref:flagellar biosynthetic protein FliQ n=1 Tax=Silanimonas lenta TaxID=265429 RepID=UPI00041BA1C0|nr:flagellar biosynthetic protein FliQ [Silanimonas lenta]
MTPETAITELRAGLELALMVGGPLLVAVLAVGVVVGLLQAATQVNEPTVAFVAKAVAMVVALAAMGSLLIGMLVDYTIALFQRIPQIVG